MNVPLPGGFGCEWMTSGDVPDSPGLYAFTVADADERRITYVGRTAHLWMVTRGHLPKSRGSRPGQRYGRPLYAGTTRKRINMLVAVEVAGGRCVQHWVRPLQGDLLVAEEEALIQRWHLRQLGWNLS
jgi:hypothetical protein